MTTIRSPRSSLVLPVLALAACLVAVSAAAADQIVYFVNGKAMTVKSVERGERFTILEMEGGGRMGVPTEQIERIEEFQLQPPPVQQPMPLAAPVAQIPIAPPTPAALAGVAPATPAVPGPGMGGVATPSGQGVQGMAPINVGGAPQAYQSPRPQQAFANRPAIGGPAGALQPAPGYQRPALYGPGGRRLGRQGMGRRGGPTPYGQPQGAQHGQTTGQQGGSGGQQAVPPPDPPDDPGDAEGQGTGEPEPQEPPTGGEPQTPGGGEPQTPGGTSGD